MIILLISILVYVLTIICWFFMILHEERQHCHTIGDVLDLLYDTVCIIPIANTIFLLVWCAMYAVSSLKLHWNKFRNIKLK